MKSSTQSGVSSVPLVLPTNAKHPFAKLVVKGDLGQVVQQWLILQNKCTVGSASTCAVRCELPGIAPYHALLVIGAKQTFIRALAPKLTRSGQAINELLLTESDNQFEIAGHKFELLRSTSTVQRSTTPLPSASRLKFTLARPFELNRSRPSADSAMQASTQSDTTLAINNAAELNARWIAELIQSAVQPLEHQLLNMIEPLNAVQSELLKNQQTAKLQPKRRRLPKISRQLLKSKQNPATLQPPASEPIAPAPVPEIDRPIPIAIEVLFAKQAASLDILSDRLADVNSQLSSLERIVADNITTTNENLPPPTPSNQEAIDRLQNTTEQLAQLLRDLQSRQFEVEKSDDSWREEIREQINHLQKSWMQPISTIESILAKPAIAEVAASEIPQLPVASAKILSQIESDSCATIEPTAPVAPGAIPVISPALPVIAPSLAQRKLNLPIVAPEITPPATNSVNAHSQAVSVSSSPAINAIPGVLPGFAPSANQPPLDQTVVAPQTDIAHANVADYAPWIQEEVIDSVDRLVSEQNEFSALSLSEKRGETSPHYETAEQADAAQFGFDSMSAFAFPPAAPVYPDSVPVNQAVHNQAALSDPHIPESPEAIDNHSPSDVASALTSETQEFWSTEESATQVPATQVPEAMAASQYVQEPAVVEVFVPTPPLSTATLLPAWWTDNDQEQESISSPIVGHEIVKPAAEDVAPDANAEFNLRAEMNLWDNAPYSANSVHDEKSESLLDNEFSSGSLWSDPAPLANAYPDNEPLDADDAQLDSKDARELSSLFHMFSSDESSSESNVVEVLAEQPASGEHVPLEAVSEDQSPQAEHGLLALAGQPLQDDLRGDLEDELEEDGLEIANEVETSIGNPFAGIEFAVANEEECLSSELDQFGSLESVRTPVVPMYKLPEQEPVSESEAL